MIFWDGRWLCLAWHGFGTMVLLSYRRYPTTYCVGVGPLEIVTSRWGQRLTRWRDVVDAKLVYVRNQKGALEASILHAPYIVAAPTSPARVVHEHPLTDKDRRLKIAELVKKYPVPAEKAA